MGTWASGPQFDWQLGTVQLTEYDDDGFLGLQIDSLGDQGGMDPLDAVHPFGFEGRPNDPEDDATGNLVLYTFEGDEGYALALGDYRLVSKLPELKKGGARWYCAKGSHGVLDGEDGTWTQYIPCEWDADGNATKAHVLQMGLDANGKRVTNIVTADGYAILMEQDKGIIIRESASAWMEFKDGTLKIYGNVKIYGSLDATSGSPMGLPVLLGSPPGVASTTMKAL